MSLRGKLQEAKAGGFCIQKKMEKRKGVKKLEKNTRSVNPIGK